MNKTITLKRQKPKLRKFNYDRAVKRCLIAENGTPVDQENKAKFIRITHPYKMPEESAMLLRASSQLGPRSHIMVMDGWNASIYRASKECRLLPDLEEESTDSN
jgi:hypothetical protein